jgi:hypothetical protein
MMAMMRTHLNRALAFAAVMLLASSATAQSPNAAPAAKANADKKDEKKADKPADKAEKAGDKADDKAKGADNKAGDMKDSKAGGDRDARKNAEHAAQKAKLAAMLKGPPDEALRQELRRHAERTARLERIKAVATEAKDTDTVAKATKLLEKENARHEKWMSKVQGTPSMGENTGPKPGTPAAPAATDNKGGAK